MKIVNKIYTVTPNCKQGEEKHNSYFLRHKVLASVIGVAINLVSINAMAASVAWTPDADGDWEDAVNWNSGPVLPGVSDDVTIDVGGG